MKKLRFLFALLSVSLFSYGQAFQGVATYHEARDFDVKLDSNSSGPMQGADLEKMIRDAMQSDKELHFNQFESEYKEVEELESENGTRRGMRMMAAFMGSGSNLYSNIKTKESLTQSEFFGKVFLIVDTLEAVDWKLQKESKQIGAYTCYKATAVLKTVEYTFTVKDGERSKQEDSVTTTITAWYTPQIPISSGPAGYWGLPGLILELNDGSMQYLCTKIALNPKEGVSVEKPSSGERVSEAEYERIVREKVEQMQQMYGGDRREGGNRNIEIRMR